MTATNIEPTNDLSSMLLAGMRNMAIQERLSRGVVLRNAPAILDTPSESKAPCGSLPVSDAVASSSLLEEVLQPSVSTSSEPPGEDTLSDSLCCDAVVDFGKASAPPQHFENVALDFVLQDLPAIEPGGHCGQPLPEPQKLPGPQKLSEPSSSGPSVPSVAVSSLGSENAGATSEEVPNADSKSQAEGAQARVDPKEVYRIERQRRNRLSAARSNAKRRAHRDGLRGDLVKLEARKAELMKRESECVALICFSSVCSRSL